LIGEDVVNVLKNGEDKEEFVYTAANVIKISADKKQKLLEADKLSEKFDILYRYLNDELEISKLEKKISATVKRNIEKGQKDFYLREQLKAIHTELGDDENEKLELEDAIRAKGMPEEVENKALKELSRMSRMPTSSPDYNVLRNYIDWLLDLEWSKTTTDTEKLSDAVAVLNADHYGLEKIKERITEYLAVLKLTDGMNAPILCLVGPPGVGKTSVATSVARALNRNFVRMSLGGVRDEAEIRGHRKTYVGAMPGRIISAIKNAGSINPVFLLDEIDKLSSDSIHGDPSSALLEVLDPAQNSTFRDRYLEVPYDLSKVLFITTANDLSTIPAPLLDRMEIIELSGYTQEEKREIAKRYLVPKKRDANGLKEGEIKFTDGAIDAIADGYTREAGVRTLERQIDAVCRKVAVKKANGEECGGEITAEKIEEYLGAPRYNRGDEMPKNNL
ncbi:MAG: AAA family ATPase, partial [Clostridia bacterium]|nr:AAA family ATPase [Clostridia bacterium]